MKGRISGREEVRRRGEERIKREIRRGEERRGEENKTGMREVKKKRK